MRSISSLIASESEDSFFGFSGAFSALGFGCRLRGWRLRPPRLPLLRSEPSEASVTVGEDYRGRTPLELPLAPGRTHEIRLTRPGHDAASQQVRLEPGETRELTIVLSPRQGEVEVRVTPGDAEVFVNGESQGQGSRVLTLTALPQQIRIPPPDSKWI